MAKKESDVVFDGVETVEVPVSNSSRNQVPEYKNSFDAGCDCKASLPEGQEVIIAPGNWAIIPLGIKTAIPTGYFGMLVGRSGLAAKSGVTLGNGFGVIN